MILILNTNEETLLYTLLIDFCQGRTRVAGYKHDPKIQMLPLTCLLFYLQGIVGEK